MFQCNSILTGLIERTAKMDKDSFKNCPHCGGKIKSAAKKCKHCKTLLTEAPVKETTQLAFAENTENIALKYYSIVDVRIIYGLIAISAILLILLIFTGLKLLRNGSTEHQAGQDLDSSDESIIEEQARPFYLDMITVKDDAVDNADDEKTDAEDEISDVDDENDEKTDNEEKNDQLVPAVEQKTEVTPTHNVDQQNQITETPGTRYFNPENLSKDIPEWLKDEIERHIYLYQNGTKFIKWGYDDGFKWAINYPDPEKLLFHNYTGSVFEKFRAEQARGLSTGGEYWFVDNSLFDYRSGWNLAVRGYLLTLFLKAALEELENQ